MATKRQQAHSLISLYDKLYEAATGRSYKGNRHADSWGFQDIIDDIGYDEAKALVEYLFKLPQIQTRQWFLYNYHRLAEALERNRNEKARKEALMRETNRRVEEYESRSEGDI